MPTSLRPAARYIDPATWVATWRRAGQAMDAVRSRELETFDVALFIRSTAEFAHAARAPSDTSGLIEQQRILHRRPE